MALLEVENLQTHFRTPDGVNRAVDGVSFTVEAGETLAIVGESGCGKSVTANSILRLVPQPPGKIAGAIRFEGVDLLGLSERAMREHPRQPHQHDLSGADDEPQSGARRSATRSPKPCGCTSGSAAAAADARAVEMLELVGIAEPRTARARISAPALRRHAAAGDDRDGACLQSEAPDRRRAHHRARRHHPGANPRPHALTSSGASAPPSSSSPTTSAWWRKSPSG